MNFFLGARGRLHFAAASLLAQLEAKLLQWQTSAARVLGFVPLFEFSPSKGIAQHARINHFTPLTGSYFFYRISMQSP